VTTRRLAIAGLVALLTLTTGAGACDGYAPGDDDSAGTTRTATQILTDAAAKAKGQSYKFTLAYGALLTGDGARSADGATGTVNLTISDQASGVTLKVGALLIGATVYLKMDFGPLGSGIPGLDQLGDRWMRVDAAKVSTANLGLSTGADTSAADSIVKGVVSAERVSDTEISGTIDLTKSTPPGVSADDLQALPAANRIVPFTATLDGEGRFAKIVIRMPAVAEFPASDLMTTFADYGTAVAITRPPAADVVPAPDMIYQFLQ
jgi:hypothetical protein